MPSKPMPRDQDYQDPPTLPALRVYQVATGGDVINAPEIVPRGVAHQLSRLAVETPASVLVIDLGNSRWETETLLRMLTDSVSSTRGRASADTLLVVATSQRAVARIVEMLAVALDVTLFVTPAADRLGEARPVGRVTHTDLATLSTLRGLGGRVTASRFALAADLEVTAAGNRLSRLANRGYLSRVPRSRREGDEYVSLDWLAGRDEWHPKSADSASD